MRLSEACEAHGLSTVAVRNWAIRGYLPELEGQGKGFHRNLTPEHVRLIRVTACVVGLGITPAFAARWARALLATGQRVATADLGDPSVAISMDMGWLDEPST